MGTFLLVFIGTSAVAVLFNALPGPKGGFFWVYIAAPLVGGAAAAACFRFVIAPFMSARESTPIVCGCESESNNE
ncbi:MAG: hypothetical protein PVJ69_17845 [Desulfobacteraceae bacterium]